MKRSVSGGGDGGERPRKTLKKGPYCYACHRGERQPAPIVCSRCCRSFHSKCIKTQDVDAAAQVVCQFCDELEKEKLTERGLPQKRFNVVLDNVLTIIAPDRNVPEMQELFCPTSVLGYPKNIVHPIGFDDIRVKTTAGDYEWVTEFLDDVRHIFHNCFVVNTPRSALAKKAKTVYEEAKQQCALLRSCAQCYEHELFNEQSWFCQPCIPPHLPALARVAGYPFWPCKVINSVGKLIEVRFFGSYNRSFVLPYACRQFSMDIPVYLERNKFLKNAMEEADFYLKLLEKEFGGSYATFDPNQYVLAGAQTNTAPITDIEASPQITMDSGKSTGQEGSDIPPTKNEENHLNCTPIESVLDTNQDHETLERSDEQEISQTASDPILEVVTPQCLDEENFTIEEIHVPNPENPDVNEPFPSTCCNEHHDHSATATYALSKGRRKQPVTGYYENNEYWQLRTTYIKKEVIDVDALDDPEELRAHGASNATTETDIPLSNQNSTEQLALNMMSMELKIKALTESLFETKKHLGNVSDDLSKKIISLTQLHEENQKLKNTVQNKILPGNNSGTHRVKVLKPKSSGPLKRRESSPSVLRPPPQRMRMVIKPSVVPEDSQNVPCTYILTKKKITS